MLYFVLTALYGVQTVVHVLTTTLSGPYAVGAVMGGLTGMGLAAALGCGLSQARQSLARGQLSGHQAVSVFALLGGVLVGALGLLALVGTGLMVGAVVRGAGSASPLFAVWAQGMTGFLTVLAVFSAAAGVKGLTLPLGRPALASVSPLAWRSPGQPRRRCRSTGPGRHPFTTRWPTDRRVQRGS